jgi:ribosome-associated toxin RatA of RatAB toxin-antitoxin module
MLTTLAVLASLALSAEMPPAAKEAGLAPAEWTKLEKGEVVSKTETFKTPEGKDGGKGRAWVIIKAPPEACFATLHKYEDIPKYMPRVKKVSFLERGEKEMRVTQEIKVAFTTVRYTLLTSWDAPKKEMHWKLDHSVKSDIAETTGGWRFLPYGEGQTFLDYDIVADTGSSIPRAIADYFTQRDLPAVLNNFKQRVESGGTWTKD